MKVLVTGGAGYIGSHTVKLLLSQGHEVVIVDNLSRGHVQAVPKEAVFIKEDIHHQEAIARILADEKIEAVLHFAAHSQVGESMTEPALYYDNNVIGTYRLLEAMREAGVDKLVFSSTAAVYGEPVQSPITEDLPLCPTNVYGQTKYMIELMLKEYSRAYGFSYVALRYFNAAGACPTGTIGEDHTPETHLLPLVLQAILGKRDSISIFGTDYPTLDGTCIRDYIHVMDLAQAHLLALRHLEQGGISKAYNLGTQKGVSVREMIETAQAVTGRTCKVKEEQRRPGDPPVLIASSEKIKKELGWEPRYSSIENIIRDAWQWHSLHEEGFGDTV